MNNKLKFLAHPVVGDVTPFHEFHIIRYSESSVNKSQFKVDKAYNQFLDFLEKLGKNDEFFKDSKWYLHQFDIDNPTKKENPIFLERDSKEAFQFISKYHRTNDINYEYAIPMVMDYNIKNKEQDKQHYFTSSQNFKDKNTLSFYDMLKFTFVEKYNSQQRDKSAHTLENMMKTMVEVCDKEEFKFVSLFDNDFTQRFPPNGSENFYEDSYQVYPHRLQHAWKSIVRGDFTQQDIPQASKVENFMKGFTLVSTLADHEYFSSYNEDHVYRANLVEIRLNELGVLPYFELVN